LLTLPETVASGERICSQLKLTQNRLVNLSILSIGKEIAVGIDLTYVREFTETKARRVTF